MVGLAVGPAAAVKGETTYAPVGCNYFIVATDMRYSILQWFSGALPSRGDVLVGGFETYGMPTVFNVKQDAEMTVWIDNFWLSRDRAVERIQEKC